MRPGQNRQGLGAGHRQGLVWSEGPGGGEHITDPKITIYSIVAMYTMRTKFTNVMYTKFTFTM